MSALDKSIGAAYEYTPFGEGLRVFGSGVMADNPLRFASKYTDAETALKLYGYRYYQATTGKWISRDPAGERGGRNLYGFVSNDTIDHTDPLGLITYADVVDFAFRLDRDVSNIPCCCKTKTEGDGVVTDSMIGWSSGASVANTAHLKKSGCVVEIATYFWWDCFAAQSEAGHLFVFTHPDGVWQQYGWYVGGSTVTKTHTGPNIRAIRSTLVIGIGSPP